MKITPKAAAIAAAVLVVAGLGATWLATRGGDADMFAQCRKGVVGGTAKIGGPFTLVDENGKTVTDKDVFTKPSLLYFGYTYCPDVCPMTLSNLAQALKKAGADTAGKVRVLFITVDPDRDTLPALKTYAAAFGPEFEGLRGSPDELATLAKRYRIAYSVTPDANPSKYQVSHSSALYVFDKAGKARLLMTSLSTTDPDIPGTAADLKRLAATD